MKNRINDMLDNFKHCECCKPELIKIKRLQQQKECFSIDFIMGLDLRNYHIIVKTTGE